MLRNEYKALQVKDIDSAGKGKAQIAVLSDIDNEGDTYEKGAFSWKSGGGQWAFMIPAHDKQAMPFGKGWVYEEKGAAMADFTLNLQTQAGREWHEALKFDLDTGKPVQEWSYGYRTLDSAKEIRDNRQVRVLKQLDVYEFSPVLRGMGSRTGTLGIKSLKDDTFTGLISGLDELAAALAEGPDRISETGRKQLADIHMALGKALAGNGDEAEQKAQQLLVDQAVAQSLMTLSRRYLRP